MKRSVWDAIYDGHFDALAKSNPSKSPAWRQREALLQTRFDTGISRPGGDLFGGLKEKLGMKLLSSFLPGIVKNLGDGQYGAGPQKVYWWLAGKKTWISIGIGAVWAFGHTVVVPALVACQCAADGTIPSIEGALGWVASVVPWLILMGIVDAGIRLEPPKKGIYVSPRPLNK